MNFGGYTHILDDCKMCETNKTQFRKVSELLKSESFHKLLHSKRIFIYFRNSYLLNIYLFIACFFNLSKN